MGLDGDKYVTSIKIFTLEEFCIGSIAETLALSFCSLLLHSFLLQESLHFFMFFGKYGY